MIAKRKIHPKEINFDYICLSDIPFSEFSSEKITDIQAFDSNIGSFVSLYCDNSAIPFIRIDCEDEEHAYKVSMCLQDALKKRKNKKNLKS